jgi:hypothetical protein
MKLTATHQATYLRHNKRFTCDFHAYDMKDARRKARSFAKNNQVTLITIVELN